MSVRGHVFATGFPILKVVCAHRSVTTIPSQALEAPVGSFLAWIEVLAIPLADFC